MSRFAQLNVSRKLFINRFKKELLANFQFDFPGSPIS